MPLLRARDVRRALGTGDREDIPEAGIGLETYVATLTGTFPDYTDSRIRAVHATLIEQPAAETVALCQRHGIDILVENGERISFWIDVAVVLAAREQGLLPPS